MNKVHKRLARIATSNVPPLTATIRCGSLIKKPFRIADTFAGTQSVKKAAGIMFNVDHWVYECGIWKGIEELGAFPNQVNVEYIGFDLYSPEDENTILDLSSDDIINKITKALPKDWIPDVWWHSPICNSYSRTLTGKGGNYYFEEDKINGTIKPREDWNIKVQPHMEKYQNDEGHKQAREFAELSLKLHANTKKIIKHFNAPFILENPAGALSKYLYKDFVKNDTNYCMYGFDYGKSTALYSNENLGLLKCNHKKNPEFNGDKHYTNISGLKTKNNPKWRRPRHWKKGVSTYANRSSVPPRLIVHAIKKVTNYGE